MTKRCLLLLDTCEDVLTLAKLPNTDIYSLLNGVEKCKLLRNIYKHLFTAAEIMQTEVPGHLHGFYTPFE